MPRVACHAIGVDAIAVSVRRVDDQDRPREQMFARCSRQARIDQHALIRCQLARIRCEFFSRVVSMTCDESSDIVLTLARYSYLNRVEGSNVTRCRCLWQQSEPTDC